MTAGFVEGLYWVALGLSIVLNVVLAGLFFLKSALNQMLTEWFKLRAERKKHVRALLVELHGRLDPFDLNYFLLVTNTHLQHSGPNQGVRDQAKVIVESLAPKHIETLEFMAGHELEFPQAIRQRIRDLRESMQMKDIGKLGDFRAILNQAQLVTDAVKVMRSDLDRMVK